MTNLHFNCRKRKNAASVDLPTVTLVTHEPNVINAYDNNAVEPHVKIDETGPSREPEKDVDMGTG